MLNLTGALLALPFVRPQGRGRRRFSGRSCCQLASPIQNGMSIGATDCSGRTSDPRASTDCMGSAALGRLFKLRTVGLHAVPTGAATSSVTASAASARSSSWLATSAVLWNRSLARRTFGCLDDRKWPGPGSPRERRKLTLVGGAIAPKVGFLAPPRTHADGQTLTTGVFLASLQVRVATMRLARLDYAIPPPRSHAPESCRPPGVRHDG